MTNGLSGPSPEVAFMSGQVHPVPTPGDLRRRYLDWWLYDLPPMHGLLRFAVYAGLLLIARDYFVSPVLGVHLYEQTAPELHRTYGLLNLLGISYIAPDALRVVIKVVQVAWVFAAIGLFSRVSAVVTAAGAAFLHGMFLSPNALNHNWFVAIYALIALCFTRTTDGWSVDYHLKKWWTGSPPTPDGRLADTGLARKAFLVMVVGFYFSAGMSKLAMSGLAWADGHTIAYFAMERTGGMRSLAKVLADNLWLCQLLAIGTLTLELGAPAALFSRKARYALMLGWACMHIGIRYAMGPRYWENILCFALLIDWGAAARTVRERLGLPVFAGERPAVPGRRAVIGVSAASLLLPLMLTVATFRVFWWPLTNVYMYCSYFSHAHDLRSGRPTADFHEAASAQDIARGYRESRPPIEATEHFSFLAGLRLTAAGKEPLYLESEVPGVAWHKQWILTVVRPVMIEDLAVKPAGRIEFDPDRPDYPAQRLMLEYLPVFRRLADPELLQDYERLELTYPLSGGPVAIASVPLSPAEE
jgi:hypothetical protein